MAKVRMVTAVVRAALPPGVTAARFRKYVAGETRAGIGMLRPDDPLCCLDRSKVEVRTLRSTPECRDLVGATEALIAACGLGVDVSKISQAAAAAVQAVKKAP